MIRIKSIIAFVAISIVIGCSKDVSIPSENGTTDTTLVPNAEDYYPLKQGNWWVYDYYKIITSTGAQTFWYRDSVWIVGDTIINGYTYAHQEAKNSNGTWWAYMRDSLGYMVMHRGEKILFSCCNFTDTFETKTEMSYNIYQKMVHTDTLIPTALGNIHSISKGYLWRNYNNIPLAEDEYLFFAKGIGMTQYCHWLYPSCWMKIEGRLIKYHIN